MVWLSLVTTISVEPLNPGVNESSLKPILKIRFTFFTEK